MRNFYPLSVLAFFTESYFLFKFAFNVLCIIYSEEFSVGWNNGVREKKIKLQPERYGLIDLAKQGALLSSHELSEEQEMTEEGMATKYF